MAEIDDRWLSVDEICKYLGIGKDTVYKWIDKHGMPAHRMGRLWKFKKEQVDKWVKAAFLGIEKTNDCLKQFGRVELKKQSKKLFAALAETGIEVTDE